MYFGNYNKTMYADKYLGETKDKYLYFTGQKDYEPAGTPERIPKNPNTSSIDVLIDSDAHTLLDKVVNTAFSIVYRLKIYNDISTQLVYTWLKTKNELLDLESSFYRGANMNIERKKSMLTKELNQLTKQKLEQKVETWKDINEPIGYLVKVFHDNRELLQDQKMLKE